MSEMIPSFKIASGARIGDYTILDQLGRGFEGEVYAALELPTRILRAIKIFPAGDAEHTKKIAHQAWHYEQLAPTGAVARYHHLGQTFLEDSGEAVIYMVFDLLDGVTLNRYLRDLRGRAAYRERESLKVFTAIVEKIARVHRLGYGVGDFQHAANVIVLCNSNEPVFCDIEAGAPNEPNRDLENDLYELVELADLVFPPALRRDIYRVVKALIEDSLQANIWRDTVRRLGKKLSDLLHETDDNGAN